MLSEKGFSNDVETQQPSKGFLAQLLHLCVIDQVTSTGPKKRLRSLRYKGIVLMSQMKRQIRAPNIASDDIGQRSCLYSLPHYILL